MYATYWWYHGDIPVCQIWSVGIKTWIFIIQEWIVPSLVEIGQVSLKKLKMLTVYRQKLKMKGELNRIKYTNTMKIVRHSCSNNSVGNLTFLILLYLACLIFHWLGILNFTCENYLAFNSNPHYSYIYNCTFMEGYWAPKVHCHM